MLSVEWYQKIIDTASDAIIATDRHGTIQAWNAGAERIFGYTNQEAMGKTLDIIIPEKLRARHWEGYQRVMATGKTRYGQELLAVPAVRKDGTRLSVEFSIVLLCDTAGKPFGTAAILRDVTARWQQEKALKERLAALEAQVSGQQTRTSG